MKKNLGLIAIISLLVTCFVSCEEEDATYTPMVGQIKIVNADVCFDTQASSGTIVYQSNEKVTFSCDEKWVSLRDSGENIIVVEVADNLELIGRSAVVSLSDGNGEVNVVVQQRGVVFGYFDTVIDGIGFRGTTISIEGKSSYEVEVVDCPSWIHFTATESGFDILVDQNKGATKREAIVTLDGKGVKAQIYFGQELGQYMEIMVADTVGDLLLFNDAASSVKYQVDANADFAVSCGEEWFKAEYNGKELTITVEENNSGFMRMGWLYYSNDAMKDSIKVRQVDPVKDCFNLGYLTFIDSEDGELYYNEIYIDSLGINILGYTDYAADGKVWQIPMTIDPAESVGVISAGAYVGDFSYKKSSYDLYTVIPKGENVSFDSSTTLAVDFYYDKYEDAIVAEFDNDLYVAAFKKGAGCSADTNEGAVFIYLYPVIYIYDMETLAEDSEASARRQMKTKNLRAGRRTPFCLN